VPARGRRRWPPGADRACGRRPRSNFWGRRTGRRAQA
jgi:hypothetical protein